MIVLCFSVLSLGSAVNSEYWTNSCSSNQTNDFGLVNGLNTEHTIQTMHAECGAYDPPAQIMWETNDQLCVRAYPSSWWDNWKWTYYYVVWNKHVDIYNIYQMNYEDCSNHVTDGYIEFDPKNVLEGELTIKYSADGKHNSCDFSAITGFEKETSDWHLSIHPSRVGCPSTECPPEP